jgi:hypothetical protein
MIVALTPEQFWKLRARCSETRRIAEGARFAIAQAQAAQDRCLADLATLYGFDASVQTFSLDDDALSIEIADTLKNSEQKP